MEIITSTPIFYIAWFITIGLGILLWNIAPHQATEIGEFMTYLASIVTAVFFVFFLTPIATQNGYVVLFFATYGAISIIALVGTFYTVALDRRDERLLYKRVDEDDLYY